MTKPILQALVLADHIYQDKHSGKMVIAGTFNDVTIYRNELKTYTREIPTEPGGTSRKHQVTEFPPEYVGDAGSPFVYTCLTGIHNSVDLELRFVDLSNNKVLLQADLKVQCDDPVLSVEVGIRLPTRLPTPHEGVYALELLYEEEMLGSWRISAKIEDRTKSKEEQ